MINPYTISITAFVGLFLAAVVGMRIRAFLPQHHLGPETKDSVRIGMGSVATMAALVLGLLVASAKSSYDSSRSRIIEISANTVHLDRLLANYGPETTESRHILRKSMESSIQRIWASPNSSETANMPVHSWSHALPQALNQLKPQSDAQASFKAQALPLASEISRMRWLLHEQNSPSISPVLLFIMLIWLMLTFLSVGLFAPVNATSVFAQAMAALSVAGAIFLILELDQPLTGLIQISPEPAQNALRLLGQ